MTKTHTKGHEFIFSTDQSKNNRQKHIVQNRHFKPHTSNSTESNPVHTPNLGKNAKAEVNKTIDTPNIGLIDLQIRTSKETKPETTTVYIQIDNYKTNKNAKKQ